MRIKYLLNEIINDQWTCDMRREKKNPPNFIFKKLKPDSTFL